MAAECGIFIYGGKSDVSGAGATRPSDQANREFYVARFLPVQPGHLLFRYLDLHPARYQQYLIQEQEPGLRGSAQRIFSERTRATSARHGPQGVSPTPSKDSPPAQAWGKGITLQMLRQLSVGVSEKHVTRGLPCRSSQIRRSDRRRGP